MHALNALKEVSVTYEVLKRSLNLTDAFLLTRSSYPGIGRYSAQWSGDNAADWFFLYFSVANIMNFQVITLVLTPLM